jgi:hypothetical protein
LPLQIYFKDFKDLHYYLPLRNNHSFDVVVSEGN